MVHVSRWLVSPIDVSGRSGDPWSLAEALARTLDDPPAEDALPSRAQDFTVERAVEAYAEVLGLEHP